MWYEVTVAYLAQNGNLEGLKWLREKIDKKECNFVVLPHCNSNLVCNYASRYGHVNCLEWLLNNGYSFSDRDAIIAARNGFLGILELLHERGLKLTYQVLEAAAKGGSVEVIEWLLSKRVFCMTGEVCLYAANKGHLEALKCFVSHGWRVNSNTFCQGSIHIEIMEYLKEIGCRIEPDTVRYLLREGNLKSLKWIWKKYPLRRQELFTQDNCMWYACSGGNLELVRFVEKKGEVLKPEHFSAAIISGNVELLKILREKGAQISVSSFSNACFEGHIPVLEYLKGLSCEYTGDCYNKAAGSNNLEVLRWLKENGYLLTPTPNLSSEELKKMLLYHGKPGVIEEEDPLIFSEDRVYNKKLIYNWLHENVDSLMP